jgi:site-specific recombinase XerD
MKGKKGICETTDGQRIAFTLKKRDRDPFFFVRFRGPNGTCEPSTKENTVKNAMDSAAVLIRKAFNPDAQLRFVGWKEVDEELPSKFRAANLRPRTTQDYEMVLGIFRKMFPESLGPQDVTERQARAYKQRRMDDGLDPRTVSGNINKLSCLWQKWFLTEAEWVVKNPWEKVEAPKCEEKDKRIIEPHERKQFENWLCARWPGWRLPLLFLEVKGSIGCRITELCTLPSSNLERGRIKFDGESCKGRRSRQCKVPAILFAELQAKAGPQYVWERFADELRAIFTAKKRGKAACQVKDFSPSRLRRWLQAELVTYFQETGARPFHWHNLRGTAMSRAKSLGVSYDDAAIAFDCEVATMRGYYVSFDETKTADAVFDRIQAG